MEKAGWQVSALLLGVGLIGTGFAAMANRSALKEAENYKPTCPAPPVVAEEKIEEGPATWVPIMSIPDNVRCQGGAFLLKTESGFESLTKEGKPIACHITGFGPVQTAK